MIKSRKINVGITIGDPNGIGIEIILKSLSDFSLFKECNFIIYSSLDLIKKQKQHFQIDTPSLTKTDSYEDLSDTKINVKEVFSNSQFNFGESDKQLSELGIISLKEAIKAIKGNKIDILVTAPINKDLSYSNSFKYCPPILIVPFSPIMVNEPSIFLLKEFIEKLIVPIVPL